MKFTIKNRFTDEVIVEGEAKNFIEFVENNKADLSKANLSEANLYKKVLGIEVLE